MQIASHALLFALSAAVIWFLSGILIDATDRVAKRYKKPGFAVAFLVLGLLTSIGEFSVATNATLNGVPQVSAGNLMGASTVIFLLILPLLAILGNGIYMTKAIRPKSVILVLFVVLLPTILAIDGDVTKPEGIIMLLLYGVLVYKIQKRKPAEEIAKEALRRTKRELLQTRHATAMDLLKILLGGVLIFIAGHILVQESVFFAQVLTIPVSFIGLLLLSIGTNIPELVIAIRCVIGRHKDIAFGDYMGSAAANTLIFGFLVIANGSFPIEPSEALLTFVIFAVGCTLFYVFSKSKGDFSRKEGAILVALYVLFLCFQITNAVRLHDAAPVDTLSNAETASQSPTHSGARERP